MQGVQESGLPWLLERRRLRIDLQILRCFPVFHWGVRRGARGRRWAPPLISLRRVRVVGVLAVRAGF